MKRWIDVVRQAVSILILHTQGISGISGPQRGCLGTQLCHHSN